MRMCEYLCATEHGENRGKIVGIEVIIPHDCVQNRTVEQTVDFIDVSKPPGMEQTVGIPVSQTVADVEEIGRGCAKHITDERK